MVMQGKSVNYSEIPAIAVAAYTVFKIVTATMSYVKTRKLSFLFLPFQRPEVRIFSVGFL